MQGSGRKFKIYLLGFVIEKLKNVILLLLTLQLQKPYYAVPPCIPGTDESNKEMYHPL